MGRRSQHPRSSGTWLRGWCWTATGSVRDVVAKLRIAPREAAHLGQRRAAGPAGGSFGTVW